MTTTQTDPELGAFILLTLPNVTVHQLFDNESMAIARGELALECVPRRIPPAIGHQTANPFPPSQLEPSQPQHDLWLVLSVGDDFTHTLQPGNELLGQSPVPMGGAGPGGSHIGHTDGRASYVLSEPSIPGAQLIFELAAPTSQAEKDDLETFEALLRQYGSLDNRTSALEGVTISSTGSHGLSSSTGLASAANEKQSLGYSADAKSPYDEDLRGHLLLVNEDNGQIIGELDTDAQLSNEPSLQQDNRPVLLDFGTVVNDYAGRVVHVERVPEGELNDWMLRGADRIGRAITFVGGKATGAIIHSAERYSQKTTSNSKPVVFGATTKSGLRTAHNASVGTVRVTKKTIGQINSIVDRVVASGKKGKPMLGKPNHETMPNYSKWGKADDPYGTGSAVTSQSSSNAPALPPRPDKSSPVPQAPLGPSGQPPTTGSVAYGGAYGSEKAAFPDMEFGTTVPAPVGADGKPTKRPFLNRVVLASEIVLSSLEATANDLITAGTAAASTTVGHKYGPDAGHAAALVGGTARNVALVYVDVRGIARRGLLKATAKSYVKARLKGTGQTVRLQPGATNAQASVGDEVVVGVPTVGREAPPPAYDEKNQPAPPTKSA